MSTPATTLPQWISPTLHRTAGRDPLALQTITQDRIIPLLLPGILALSGRARYFSFHCFLLDEYARRQLPATNAALSKFMLAREYEHALAVEMCPRECGSSPVGARRSGPAAAVVKNSYDRGESVESALAGYGLYYRSPLADLGLVARAGTLLGDKPTAIDILVPGGRGRQLAETFRTAVADTDYFTNYFVGLGTIPRDTLEEYAEVACLCRLDEYIDERNLIRGALFTSQSDELEPAARQRRHSFAMFLAAIGDDPAAADERPAFRNHVWEDFLDCERLPEARAQVTSQWTALILKEYMQESLSAMWIDLCKTGLRNQPDDGFSPEELSALLRTKLAAAKTLRIGKRKISSKPTMLMNELNAQFASATSKMSLEDLRRWAREQGSAIAGLAFLKLVIDRLPRRDSFSETDRSFLDVGVQRSMRQEGLLQVARAFEAHMEEVPTVADTVEWALRGLVIEVHERVAYSKLPNFTFRFRWENGRLRFYDLGVWPFDLADMRHASMSQLSFDLGYWRETADGGKLTRDGRTFISEAFK